MHLLLRVFRKIGYRGFVLLCVALQIVIVLSGAAFAVSDEIITEKQQETATAVQTQVAPPQESIFSEYSMSSLQISLGACPRISISFKIEEFFKNKHRHMCDIPSIIF